MSFALDRYEPVAFHAHPELMRAAEAQTAVLSPAAPAPAAPAPAPPTPAPPTPAPPAPAPAPAAPEPPAPAAPAPAPAPAPVPVPAPEPIAAYLVAMGAVAPLRAQLADFLDAAGTRRDVRVSVGVADGCDVAWVLRDEAPHRVRALPRYPEGSAPADPAAVLAATAAAVEADAAGEPARRQLVILVWDRPPLAVTRPPGLASALLLHTVDAVHQPAEPGGGATRAWVLARSRPGTHPSPLAHAGRLLDRWEAFAPPPRGLVLGQG